MDVELTKEERNGINTLERLAKRWPKSLWLFVGEGTLSVQKLDDDGEMRMRDSSQPNGVESVAHFKAVSSDDAVAFGVFSY